MISKNYVRHPFVVMDVSIGIQGYATENLFCVPANLDNNFLSYGIAESFLLVGDQKQPFEAGRLNVFQTEKIVDGRKQLKLSLSWLEAAPYIGRVIMAVNRCD